MTLSELVEAKAREAATIILEKATNSGNWELEEEQDAITSVADEVQSAIIATLNECGFREALEWMTNGDDVAWAESVCICQNNNDCAEYGKCDCICHTAAEKLKQLEEMSK